MKEISIGKTMTVKEISEATGVPRRTILDIINRLSANSEYPLLYKSVVKSSRGKPTRVFDALEVALISREIKRAHNVSVQRREATTRLERVETIKQAFDYLMEDVKDLRGQINKLTPDAEVARKIANSQGFFLPQVAGKMITRHPNLYIQQLVDEGVLYRRGKSLLPTQQYQDSDYFVVKASYNAVTNKTFAQMYITPKGLAWLTKRTNKKGGNS